MTVLSLCAAAYLSAANSSQSSCSQALFLAGYLAAYSLGAWAAAVGAAGFALGLIPAFVRDRRLKKRPPDHVITGFVK